MHGPTIQGPASAAGTNPTATYVHGALRTTSGERVFDKNAKVEAVMAGTTPHAIESDTAFDGDIRYRTDGYGGRLAIFPLVHNRSRPQGHHR
jgi:hypothetical protein